MEKIKEVEKGRTIDELGCLAGIFFGYSARPMEFSVSFVSERIRDLIVASPKSDTSGESNPLYRKSMAETEGMQRIVAINN